MLLAAANPPAAADITHGLHVYQRGVLAGLKTPGESPSLFTLITNIYFITGKADIHTWGLIQTRHSVLYFPQLTVSGLLSCLWPLSCSCHPGPTLPVYLLYWHNWA